MDFYLNDKAIIWPWQSDMCHIRSTAANQTLTRSPNRSPPPRCDCSTTSQRCLRGTTLSSRARNPWLARYKLSLIYDHKHKLQ